LIAVYCDQCGLPLPAGAAACPRCGAAVEALPVVPAQRGPSPGEGPVARPPDGFAGGFARGPGARAWLGAILLRNVRGTAAGIFGAWFNVPFTILMAVIGAFVGAIVGLFHGSFLGPQVVARVDRVLQWILPLPMSVGEFLPTASVQIGLFSLRERQQIW